MKRIKTTIIASVLVILLTTIVLNMTIKEASAKTPAVNYTYDSICIQSGDSLWSIAENALNCDQPTDRQIYDMVLMIKQVNGLSTDTIHSGSFLVIPHEQTA